MSESGYVQRGWGLCSGGGILVLTPSGSHQNTYSWHAGGTHPTAMLSYLSSAFVLVTK